LRRRSEQPLENPFKASGLVVKTETFAAGRNEDGSQTHKEQENLPSEPSHESKRTYENDPKGPLKKLTKKDTTAKKFKFSSDTQVKIVPAGLLPLASRNPSKLNPSAGVFERLFRKNLPNSLFSSLVTTQHICINESETEVNYQMYMVEKPDENQHSEHSDDEEKSDYSEEENPNNLPSYPGGPTTVKKPSKILIAELSPDGYSLAVACRDDSVALFSVLDLATEVKHSRNLFDNCYRRLCRNNPAANSRIVNLCWARVITSYEELQSAARSYSQQDNHSMDYRQVQKRLRHPVDYQHTISGDLSSI